MKINLDVPLEVEVSDLVPEDEMWLYYRTKQGAVRLARITGANQIFAEAIERNRKEEPTAPSGNCRTPSSPDP